jgi:hypothetical protein
VQEGSAEVADADMLAGEQMRGLDPVVGAPTGTGQQTREASQPTWPLLEWLRAVEAADLNPFYRSGNGKCGNVPVHADECVILLRDSELVATLRVKNRWLEVEADVPAVSVPGDRGE